MNICLCIEHAYVRIQIHTIIIVGNFEGLIFRGLGQNGFSRAEFSRMVSDIAIPIHELEFHGG